MDRQLFSDTVDEITGQAPGNGGIGTLGEKTVHSILKKYYSPNPENHEVKIGSFVADIYNEDGIIEIQTRSFNRLRRKLSFFLQIAPVTIVYPVHNIKWIRWVNPQTGEISPPRKSPKPGTPYLIFSELYRIKDFLLNPNLRFKIVMMNLEEYRLLDGWSKDKKKGSSRCDRIPTELVNEISISNPNDYRQLIPKQLPPEFTSMDFKKASGLSRSNAQIALNILLYVGVIDRIGRKGKAYLYSCR